MRMLDKNVLKRLGWVDHINCKDAMMMIVKMTCYWNRMVW